MEYTVNIKPINSKSKLVGVATATFENQFKVNGIMLFKGTAEGQISVVMPYYKRVDPVNGTQDNQSIVVLSKELGEKVRETVKDMYKEEVYNKSSNPGYLAKSDVPPLNVHVKNITPYADTVVHPDLRGFANLAVCEEGTENKIHVNGVRIRECQNGDGQKWLSVSMPREKVPTKDGNFTYSDQCHPVTGPLRTAINQGIVGEYKRIVNEYATEDEMVNPNGETKLTNDQAMANQAEMEAQNMMENGGNDFEEAMGFESAG